MFHAAKEIARSCSIVCSAQLLPNIEKQNKAPHHDLRLVKASSLWRDIFSGCKWKTILSRSHYVAYSAYLSQCSFYLTANILSLSYQNANPIQTFTWKYVWLICSNYFMCWRWTLIATFISRTIPTTLLCNNQLGSKDQVGTLTFTGGWRFKQDAADPTLVINVRVGEGFHTIWTMISKISTT